MQMSPQAMANLSAREIGRVSSRAAATRGSATAITAKAR